MRTAAAVASWFPFQATGRQSDLSNSIIEENKKPGTRDWILLESEIAFDPATVDNLWMGPIRSSRIEGYANKLYVRQGEEISFHVSSKPATPYTIDIYRIGYYQGHGGRLIKSIGPLAGQDLGTPEADPDTYLIECDWEAAHIEQTTEDWVSGFYVAKLKTSEGWANYISFVVVDDDKHDFVFQVADFNSHAYNRWPVHHSLYNNIDTGIDNYWGPRNISSFRRPQAKLSQLVDLPLTLGAGEFFAWQYPFVFWAEMNGYDLTYISNMTLHDGDASVLTRAKGLLIVGHDEYWSDTMYANVRQARDHGVNIAFFCGNSVFGRLQLTPGLDGTPSLHFRRNGRLNDKDLVGSGSGSGIIGGGDWVIRDADHWIFKDTGLRNGDRIEGIVGWEYHNAASENIPNLRQLAFGPTNFYEWPTWENKKSGKHGTFISTYYEVPDAGSFVFNAATCWWVYGLEGPPGWRRSKWYDCRQSADERVAMITRNVLDGIIGRGGKMGK
jgi:hypothetical protein